MTHVDFLQKWMRASSVANKKSQQLVKSFQMYCKRGRSMVKLVPDGMFGHHFNYITFSGHHSKYIKYPKKAPLVGYAFNAISIGYCSNHLYKQIKFIQTWREAFVSIKEILTFLDNCLFFIQLLLVFRHANKECHHDQCGTEMRSKKTESLLCMFISHTQFLTIWFEVFSFLESCLNNQRTEPNYSVLLLNNLNVDDEFFVENW